MRLVVESPHSKYGSAMIAIPYLGINRISTGTIDKNNIEIMTIDIEQCIIISIWTPPLSYTIHIWRIRELQEKEYENCNRRI